MTDPDFMAIYKCKTPYNLQDTLHDLLAWIRQERLEQLAKRFSQKIAHHERFWELSGDEIVRFDEMLRPLLIVSFEQRKRMMEQPTRDETP